ARIIPLTAFHAAPEAVVLSRAAGSPLSNASETSLESCGKCWQPSTTACWACSTDGPPNGGVEGADIGASLNGAVGTVVPTESVLLGVVEHPATMRVERTKLRTDHRRLATLVSVSGHRWVGTVPAYGGRCRPQKNAAFF